MKNFGPMWLWTILPLHILLCQLYALVSCIRGNFALGWAIERAYWWNLQHFAKTRSLRKKVQRTIRVCSDTSLEKKIMFRPKLSYYKSLFTGNLLSYEE